MKKQTYILLPLLVLALFAAGCGKQAEITGEVTKEVVQEQTTEGSACETNADCGEKEPLGEPFCLGTGKYQRYQYQRCGFRTKVCEASERDERIGSC
ncbi:MAG: hypothetical protein KKG60_00255 [Nanoarchaeota archaeon]|nr:hypothetical protein [Nanoarchaeota archaeon]